MTLTIEELLDREMIRDVLADYAVSMDLAPDTTATALVNAFHPDGVMITTDGHVYSGRAEIEGYVEGLTKKRAGGPEVYARHWKFPCRFSFPRPGHADTVTYTLVLTEKGLDQVCTHRDHLVKEEGRWYIKERRISIEYLTADSRLDLPTMVVLNRHSPAPAQ